MKASIFFISILIFIQANLAVAFPDLMDINHISAKGRVQDKEYHPDLPIVDELISSGPLSIPFLIERLKSKKAYDDPVFDFWPYVEERHVALAILTDFFLDPSWRKSTAPDMCWSALISVQRKYPNLAIQDILRDHFTEKDWDLLILKWELFWKTYKEDIYWDSTGRFFRIKGKELKLCQ